MKADMLHRGVYVTPYLVDGAAGLMMIGADGRRVGEIVRPHDVPLETAFAYLSQLLDLWDPPARSDRADLVIVRGQGQRRSRLHVAREMRPVLQLER